ncbi:naringenin 8-dimethylallyltransferase 2, chloroplastic-like isoform X1 [Arachis stenosperma]|uniref:naringenin 8-dimethylallyltransferase 2, chloroplastic-like isoform X1 n=1 Tax=Arachis stenosperma TaxID=217475 RepID=UPI0025AC30A2|nr:naringenin 8-dimethylallyltransferase 2, chloroplastic-like isoform X1 [Arachis stenosperma]
MAFGHLVSIPRSTSSIATTAASCWKNKKFADNYYANSYGRRALWQSDRNLTKDHSIKTSLQHNISKLHYNPIERGSRSNKIEKTYLTNASSSAQSHESEPQVHESPKALESIKKGLVMFLQFCRLYAFLGMIPAGLSSSLLAVDNFSEISPLLFLKGVLQYIVTFFFTSQFVMGVNQLSDVEIDKINKPDLPLASGEYSFTSGVILVTSFLLAGFGVAWMLGSQPLIWSVVVTAALMGAYSVNFPLLRWKRSIILTSLSNAIAMLASFHIGPFLHMKTFVLKKAATFPRSMILGCVVIGLFYTIITLTKDLGDVEGDKAAGLKTLPIRLGVKPVFWLCVSLIQMAYGIAITMGALSPVLWSKIVTVVAHAFMVFYVWNHALNSVDLSSKDSLHSFHLFMFKLVTVEGILIQFVR